MIYFFELIVLVSIFLRVCISQSLKIYVVPFSEVDIRKSSFNPLSIGLDEITVFSILDNVFQDLDHSISRRFVWTEIEFFKKWYHSLSYEKKQRFKRLLKDGQFEFANGFGRLEESLTKNKNLRLMLHETLRYLDNTFDYKIESYFNLFSLSGHSNSTMKVLSEFDFKFSVISNVHNLLLEQLNIKRQPHVNWMTTDETIMLTHILDSAFNVLDGYDFEEEGVRQVTNSKRRAQKLVKLCRERATLSKIKVLLLPFGGPYKFLQSLKQFNNLEKIFLYINREFTDVKIQFSTFREYFKEVQAYAKFSNIKFPTFRGDFFPSRGANQLNLDLYATPRHVNNFNSLFDGAISMYSLARINVLTKFQLHDIHRILEYDQNGIHTTLDESNDMEMWTEYLFHTLKSSNDLVTMLNAHIFEVSPSAIDKKQNNVETLIEEASETLRNIILEAIENLLSKPYEQNKVLKPELTIQPFKYTSQKEFYQQQQPVVLYSFQNIKRAYLAQVPLPFLADDLLQDLQVLDSNLQPIKSECYHERGRNGEIDTVLLFQAQLPGFGIETYFITAVPQRSRIFLETATGNTLLISKQFLTSTMALNSASLRSNQKVNKKLEPSARVSPVNNQYVETLNDRIYLENKNLVLELSAKTGLILSVHSKFHNRKFTIKQLIHQSKLRGADDDSIIVSRLLENKILDFSEQLKVSTIKGNLHERVIVDSPFFTQTILLPKVGSYTRTIDISLTLKLSEAKIMLSLVFETDLRNDGTFYTTNSQGTFVRRNLVDANDKNLNSYSAFGSVKVVDNSEEKESFAMLMSYEGVRTVKAFDAVSDNAQRKYPFSLSLFLYSVNELELPRIVEDFEIKLKLTFGTHEMIDAEQNSIARSFHSTGCLYALQDTKSNYLLDSKVWQNMFGTNFAQFSQTSSSKTDLQFMLPGAYSDSTVVEISNKGRKNIFIDFTEMTTYSMSSVQRLYNNQEGTLLKPHSTGIFLIDFDKSISLKSKETKKDVKQIEDYDLLRVEYRTAIEEDQNLIKILESRVKRSKSSLEDLRNDLNFIPQSSISTVEDTKKEIQTLESNLEALTDQLITRLQHMKEVQGKLDFLEFKTKADLLNSGTSNYLKFQLSSSQQFREWEATLHGIVTGAGGMLVLVLLYNLLCLKLNKMPRVPIKWVGFNDPALPTINQKSN